MRKLLSKDDAVAISAITAASAAGGTASVVVATGTAVTSATVPAAGLAGWFGFTTVLTSTTITTIVLPVAGVIAVGGFLTYGGIKAWRAMRNRPLK